MPRRMVFCVLLIAAALSAALLTGGCGSSHTEGPVALRDAVPPEPGLFGLAPPVDMLRTVSADDDRCCCGADYAVELPDQRVAVQFTQLMFLPTWNPGGDPGSDDLAYAIYVFALADYTGDPELTMHWSAPPPDFGGCFLGLGNQLTGRWDWFSNEDISDGMLTLASLAPYLDGEGRLLTVMLMTGTDVCTLSWLRWGGNVPPTAVLTADPTSGSAPLLVNFDASGSTDFDGTVDNYEWDFDENGVYSESGDEADALGSPTASFTYDSEGDHIATVRVTDADGARDTATLQVSVTDSGWVLVTVSDSSAGGSVGGDISLAVVNGNPAVSWAVRLFLPGDQYEGEMRYSRSATSTGTDSADWSELVVIDNGDWAGTGGSLAQIDGCPAASYITDNILMFARATTSSGTGQEDWGEPVSFGPKNCSSTSLAEVDGNPAICWDHGYQAWYARATTPTGASAADWAGALMIEDGG